MSGLERISHASQACRSCGQSLRPWLTVHAQGGVLARHRHHHAFAAVALSGQYVESGDTGRHAVTAGDVLIHRAHEAHIDRIAAGGAVVLVLPLHHPWKHSTFGRIADPDAVAKLAAHDNASATELLTAQFEARNIKGQDWPALLADAILAKPNLNLADWARAHGLHPGSLSRGFRGEFGVSAARYRQSARMHRAIQLLETETLSLSAVAMAADFADQPHMNRAIRRELGASPSQLWLTGRAGKSSANRLKVAFGWGFGSTV